MFNFNKLSIKEKDQKDSFVGIRKDEHSNKLVFVLPYGFDKFEKNYKNIKTLFFDMYRVFKKFRQNKELFFNKRNQNRDNAKVKNHKGSYSFISEDNNEIILYSKIDLIDKIFQTYQELEIESLIQELGQTEEINYSKIENYLDKGIFLNNHAIFIESMIGYRNIVRDIPSELIELFCYIYKELASELEQELSEQIKEIAFNFSYKYLSPEQSLFSEHSFESTINILKDCLNNIHKTVAYKNYQYWNIYEAIEYFLYGSLQFDKDDNQGFWGINNFGEIWEEMCNYMMANKKEYKIIYCDSNLPLSQYKQNLSNKDQNNIWIDKNIITENPFYLDFQGNKRWIRPDMIAKKILNKQPNTGQKDNKDQESTYVIDWKYCSHHIFNKPNYRNNNKINSDIIKSLSYEFCLSQLINEKIDNLFCIPFYDANSKNIAIESTMLDCNIKLVKMNLIKIQEIYLND